MRKQATTVTLAVTLFITSCAVPHQHVPADEPWNRGDNSTETTTIARDPDAVIMRILLSAIIGWAVGSIIADDDE